MGPQGTWQSQEIEGDLFLMLPVECLDPAMPEAVAFELFNDMS